MSSSVRGIRTGREQSHTAFLHHRGYRWAKFALLLCALCLAAYVWSAGRERPSGGTWTGYALGTVGALLVLWLTYLGVRKRRYASSLGTVKGWTSAHVYLGLALVVIATLHCAFQFGLNVHTLAYGLMVVVIASGLWGITAYAQLPQAVTSLRDGSTRGAWIEELFDLNEQSIRLADPLGPDIHRRTVASAAKIRIGGGLLAQLRGPKQKRQEQANLVAAISAELKTAKAKAAAFDPNISMQNTVSFMAGQMVAADRDAENAKRLQQLLDLLARRNALVERINQDIRLHGWLQLWLLVHVPLSFALIAALIAHVVSVFYYW